MCARNGYFKTMTARNKIVKKPVIGFDMDGVILDHHGNKRAILRKFGLPLTKKELASDNIMKRVPIDLAIRIHNLLYRDSKFATTPDIYKNVMKVLTFLQKNNITYYLVSRRHKPTTKFAIRALQKHKLWPRFFNNRNTFFVHQIAGKHEKMLELKISHYVDDQPSVLKELKSVKNRILFDPHGSHGSAGHYKKIASWNEFLKGLRDIM